MNELVRLLVELSEDPHRREEFLNDPEAVLDASSLSQEQRAALLARDPRKILELLGHEGPSLYASFIAILPQPEPPDEEDSPDKPSDDSPGELPGAPVRNPPGEEPRTLEARDTSA